MKPEDATYRGCPASRSPELHYPRAPPRCDAAPRPHVHCETRVDGVDSLQKPQRAQFLKRASWSLIDFERARLARECISKVSERHCRIGIAGLTRQPQTLLCPFLKVPGIREKNAWMLVRHRQHDSSADQHRVPPSRPYHSPHYKRQWRRFCFGSTTTIPLPEPALPPLTARTARRTSRSLRDSA
jgi:hypothetical protein